MDAPIQDRYAEFLKYGGGTNAEYMAWIAEMKRCYKAAYPDMLTGGNSIKDQADFTRFIREEYDANE